MDPKRLLVGLVVAGCLPVVNLHLLSTSMAQISQPKLSRPDGGLPDQRRRIDEVIDRVAEMDYAELVDDLSTHSERFEMAQAAGHSSPVTGLRLHTLRQVLADRRMLKLYELINALPADKQRTAPVELFQSRMKLQQELLTNFRAENVWTLQANSHALHVAMFLCAVYADPADVLELCDEWTESRFGKPDPLFAASLYAMMITQQKQLSAEALRQRVDRLRESLKAPRFELPPLVSFRIYRSSAHTTELDFLSRHGAVPADSPAVFKTIVGFDDWKHTGVMGEYDETHAASETIRGWIELE